MGSEGSAETVLELLRSTLEDDLVSAKTPRPQRVLAVLKTGYQRKVARLLLKEFEEIGLSTITGVDLGERIEVNYHFHTSKAAITVRIYLPTDRLETESLVDIVPAANLYEREVFDLFGVKFSGHPNLVRLLLPENWKKDVHPLRKDWSPEQAGDFRKKNLGEPLHSEGEVITVPFGPQHPALHEPERFLLKIEGEKVVGVDPRIGYVHRGVEKLAEDMTFIQNVQLVERICGICNVAHSLCFCRAVEAIGDIDVSERANYLRLVAYELNRIQSHLLLLGVGGYELGFETLFMYVWRDREIAMRLMEELTGNRVLSGFNTIGGVRRNLSSKQAELFRTLIPELRERAAKYQSVFDNDPTIRARTMDVGILDHHDALDLSAVGPNARCSGIKSDLRLEEPFPPYDEVPFTPVFYDEGDSWSRLKARADEILVSLDLISYAIAHLPSGPIRIRVPLRFPEGEALSRLEAPRGELIHFVRGNGTTKPERVKVRSPTLANILPICKSLEGGNVADIPVTLVSMDPCFSCTDRMAFVDIRGGKCWSESIRDIERRYRR